jgi:hypothetical protein
MSLWQPRASCQIDQNFNQNKQSNQVEHLEKSWFVIVYANYIQNNLVDRTCL